MNLLAQDLYILVCGSRDFNDFNLLETNIDSLIVKYKEKFNINDIIIIEGGARGADYLAKEYADRNNFKCMQFDADWTRLGKAAGYSRNKLMQEYVSSKKLKHVIAFWDGSSRGTAQNFSLCEKYDNPLTIINYNEDLTDSK